MPKDKNIVILDGLIGDDFKFAKTQELKEYVTFTLCINCFDKEYSDSTERTHGQSFIRLFCYDKRHVEYLRQMGAHRGMRVSIYGRLVSFKSEHKGNTFISNSVVCRDIEIIKTTT